MNRSEDMDKAESHTELESELYKEVRFYLLAELAPSAIILMDKNKDIMFINVFAEKMFGYSRNELIYRSIDTILISSSLIVKTLQDTYSTHETFAVRKDGTHFPVEFKLNSLYSEGKCTLFASVVDITERKNSEERFRILVESSPNAMILSREDSVIVLVNKKAERLFGYMREELIGNKLEMLMPFRFRTTHAESRKACVTNHAHHVDEGKHIYALRKDGTEFPVEIKLSSLVLDTSMILSTVTDITEKIIQENNKLKGDFVSNISHELRTPMNIIMGFTEMLLDQSFGSLNETQQEMLRDVKNSSAHLLRLINDILDLSKMESGKMDLNLDSFNISEAIQKVVDAFRSIFEGRNITVTLEQPKDIINVRLDRAKFQQIVHNLFLNAIQYNKPRGLIIISIELQDANFFSVHIKDTGIGISTEDMGKLFMPFVRCDPKNTSTGLGLTLTKSLVELHRGTIKAESILGEGSTFTFTLPIKLM